LRGNGQEQVTVNVDSSKQHRRCHPYERDAKALTGNKVVQNSASNFAR
jgi:hypothetical protein